MAESYLEVRLNSLRRAQNPDGGWGYFPGKQSWIEPTAWAALALHGDAESDRAWELLKSWQTAAGSWRPAQDVQIESWATALCVNLAQVRGEYGDPWRKGVEWLLRSAGVESNWMSRTVAWLGLIDPERNLSLTGWPWKPGTSSWVEPTSHTLVALKRSATKFSAKFSGATLRNRVRVGEEQLLDVRCKDGGWNYGSPAALDVDLPSYPETTALGLVGLQGNQGAAESVSVAKEMGNDTRSPLARAWLAIALRLHGTDAPAPLDNPRSDDIYITAIEALGADGGNFHFLSTGENA